MFVLFVSFSNVASPSRTSQRVAKLGQLPFVNFEAFIWGRTPRDVALESKPIPLSCRTDPHFAPPTPAFALTLDRCLID